MAAPMLFRRSRGMVFFRVSARYNSNSNSLFTQPRKGGILQYLSNRFHDVESIIDIVHKLKRWKMEKVNKPQAGICGVVLLTGWYDEVQHQLLGDDVGAALFILNLQGSFRFQGQIDWYSEDLQQKRTTDLADFYGKTLEAINVSGTTINYIGLKNFVNLKALKHLDLSGCPSIDDWCLSRLHVFADTLQSLSLARCSQVTEKGLASLHHLENLKHLDVSNLPSVPHQTFVRILLEEMLPRCYIVGLEGSQNADFPNEREEQKVN